jgi:hemin uptake protein HemP
MLDAASRPPFPSLPASSKASPPDDRIPVWQAESLTGPDGLARIRLGETCYTLRITRAGKLILTK